MERIAAILAVFVLLMNGRHVEHRLERSVMPIVITATPIPLDSSDPARVMLGPLRYLGGWSLSSTHPAFGGISSMRVNGSGELDALSDTGERFIFRAGSGAMKARLMPLPVFRRELGEPKWKWDSESMTADPATGKLWVGFELIHRICRYSSDFARIEGCASPWAMRDWPATTGMESLQRLPDGRFLGIAEAAVGPHGATDVLLFRGDPVDPATPPPAHLAYRPPEGFEPSDALWLGNGRMLVLNLRLSLSGFTALLTLVDLGRLGEGKVLTGTVVASLVPPVAHDNFEVLALGSDHGRPVLWVASDDNHYFFQRSLLLKFALPPQWVRPTQPVFRSGA